MLVILCGGFLCASEAVPTTLAPGDLVKIEVFDNPELAVTTRVPGSGSIVFPLIGELPTLAGITPETLSSDIRRRLEDGYLKQAQVTVAVLEYGQRQVFIMGSVTRPGAVKITPGRALTALQAISECGGFSDDASRKATQLLREDPLHSTRSAMNLAFSGEASDAAHDVNLLTGDVVIVPRADRVYVIGRVARPGALVLPASEPVTVSKAISLAGGFERFAKEAQVQLLRPGQAAVTIDVTKILAGELNGDAALLPGDTVFVPESRF
jgi:polysaccharide biosynthesis/export protein